MTTVLWQCVPQRRHAITGQTFPATYVAIYGDQIPELATLCSATPAYDALFERVGERR
ncbi:MAG: hypothetical protein ABR540_19000 [Acidimicrobiales bacterium]